MIKEQIWIDKSLEEVWKFIEMEFAKAFKCSPSKLIDATTSVKSKTFAGQEITLTQSFSEVIANQRLVLVSENMKDRVETTYALQSDEEHGTFLTLTEDGKGVEKKLRSWNYALMALPILNRGSKKRLRRRLESIKYLLESNGDDNDSSTISA